MGRLEIEQLADRLLPVLRKKPGAFTDYDSLAQKLKADKPSVQEAIETLASWDYKLKKRGEAVAFIEAPDVLTATEIAYGLKTKSIARNIFAYKAVKSTNDLAAEMAEGGQPEGTIVVADQQTKGRGRLGRRWYSPEGTGIYLSIVLKPEFPTEMAPAVSVLTAVALADTLVKYNPDDVRIKWPNDVLIGGRKVAGILTELAAEREKINHIIIGVGINVNQAAGDFPEEIRHLATSVRRSVKKKVRRVDLLQSFLANFEKEYAGYKRSGLKKSHAKIRKYSSLIGHEITIRSGRHEETGRAVDIDVDGRLVLERDGVKSLINAGEVTVAKR